MRLKLLLAPKQSHMRYYDAHDTFNAFPQWKYAIKRQRQTHLLYKSSKKPELLTNTLSFRIEEKKNGLNVLLFQ